ncbi:MAG: hypothetical protein HQL31_12390, partial [Planctomycetes bacterium]|nr:hypothetical protein [Planctomycetota bacterium]
MNDRQESEKKGASSTPEPNARICHLSTGQGGEFVMVERIRAVLAERGLPGALLTHTPREESEHQLPPRRGIFDEQLLTPLTFQHLRRHLASYELVVLHFIFNFASLLEMAYIRKVLGKKLIGVFHNNMDGPGGPCTRLFYRLRKAAIVGGAARLLSGAVFVTEVQRERYLSEYPALHRGPLCRAIHNFLPRGFL